jgi:hypothetical protein
MPRSAGLNEGANYKKFTGSLEQRFSNEIAHRPGPMHEIDGLSGESPRESSLFTS